SDDEDGADAGRDPDGDAIPRDEERLLDRVRRSLAARAQPAARTGTSSPPPSSPTAASTTARYNQDLIALRDEIAEARLEDVAALWAQMERLQGVSLRRAEAQGILIDPASPYFGHLRLREEAPGGRGTIER